MCCLQLDSLRVQFETLIGTVMAVNGVSFNLRDRETLALVGETGCGKSVLAKSILNLLPGNALLEGRILFKGKDLLTMKEKEISNIRAKEISIILQNPTLALNPLYSIGHQITEVFRFHTKTNKKKSHELSKKLLEKMSFRNPEKYLRMYPFQFSEGMNQRVAIAMAFALNPKIIIADEPTKGLDYRLKEGIVEELISIKEKEDSSMLLITHDLNVARKLSDRIAIMYCGEIVEMAQTKDFFENPLHPYSKGLLKSLPENGFKPIPGTSPSMISPPKGCRFHPRCPQKMQICAIKEPELMNKSGRDLRCFLHC